MSLMEEIQKKSLAETRKKVLALNINEIEVKESLTDFRRLYLKNKSNNHLARMFNGLYKIFIEKAKKEDYNVSEYNTTLEAYLN